MKRVEEKRMRQQEAATVLGISKRQVKRLLHAYCRDGSSGLISKRRGQAGNHRLAESVRAKALKHLQGKYRGFGPTLAHEKLVELDGLQISDESVRQLMIAEELWKPKKARKVAIHQMRERRACFGELVQIDGSKNRTTLVRRMIGSKGVHQPALCWSSSMMPPENSAICSWSRARAFSVTLRQLQCISTGTASQWRSTTGRRTDSANLSREEI